MKFLITGSSGLIGSAAVRHFASQGHDVFGIDNNMRKVFFGDAGDTSWNLDLLKHEVPTFQHHDVDIRDRIAVERVFEFGPFDVLIHCAAQPSHEKAKEIPLVDFEINALATVNLLEMTRNRCPDAVFIFMSTNKVYGDAPNEIPLVELHTRWDYARKEDWKGIKETCRIDQALHSLFGASKAAADIVAQEYGRYFGLRVGVFRGGCLTGSGHSAAELHGFLSYLVKVAMTGAPYRIFGYKGKQVRDQIHSADVIRAFESFIANPRPGEVYNIGGGRDNSASVLESIDLVEQVSGKKIQFLLEEVPRKGDHICYISDLSKLRADFPDWDIRVSLSAMVEEMVKSNWSEASRR
jgi:CDP-paratose 2-epimerase